MSSEESSTLNGKVTGRDHVVPIVITEVSSSSSSSPSLSGGNDHQKFGRLESRRLHSVSGNSPHRRSRHHDSRRLHRTASAKEGSRIREKHLVLRTVSDQGEEVEKHRQHRRSSRRVSQRNRFLCEALSGDRERSSPLPVCHEKDSPSRKSSLYNQRATNWSRAAISDIDALDSESPKEVRRRPVVYAVVLTTLAILASSVLLVAIMLLLTPSEDDKIRKENEEILKGVSSTLSPSINGATVNNTINMTGQPG
ncbi:uncharacterized protein LOC111086504 isoform X3 [Limulus polyphemus]|uniref:Uncharacterized protein LOC111086504 isoform X3 n=1 Tax=Limulus polyphemus TaxID=6850 RepID=A0ABM1SNY8_LIMPO|nr:uncharacterized protein LOC111086504 isoform X3 [Limulus polyphemus]